MNIFIRDSMFTSIMSYCVSLFSCSKIKAILWLFGTFILSLFGDWTLAMSALLILMIMDFFLGFTIAIIKDSLSKKKLILGGSKMFFYALTIIAFTQLDVALAGSVGNIVLEVLSFKGLIVTYFAVTEIISLIPKLHYFGVPIPDIIINKINSIRNDFDKPIV